MSSVFEALPHLIDYQPSFLALALLCMAVLIQSFLSAPLAFVNEEQIPGMPLNGGHDLLSFRVLRTYANSVENLPVFGLAVLLAIILGVSAVMVNWLAAIHVAFRFAFWMAYYCGIGRIAGGPRTLFYVGGLLANIVLVGSSIYMVFA